MRVPIIRPSRSGVTLTTVLRTHDERLLKHAFFYGALLFRGFGCTPSEFDTCLESLNLRPHSLIGSAAPPHPRVRDGLHRQR